jgi:hypothetical protein
MKMSREQNWSRTQYFPGKVLVLDGMTGTGKTLVMNVIDTLSDIAPPKFSYLLEHICISNANELLNESIGIQILQIHLDQLQYDGKISREVNFRPGDLSSIFKSKKKMKYIGRLFTADGELASERVEIENETIFLIVHQLFETLDVLTDLPGKTITQITCVRHPYYLMDHWASYVTMHGASPRDFTLTKGDNGDLPWFIKKYPELYLNGNNFEKAAICVAELNKRGLTHIDTCLEKIIVIDFEKFVLNPTPYIEQITLELEPRRITGMRKTLKSQRIPRLHINNTKPMKIYSRYGSNAHNTSLSQAEDYFQLRSRLKSLISSDYFTLLEEAAGLYEAKFGRWFENDESKINNE